MLCWSHMPHCWKSHALAQIYVISWVAHSWNFWCFQHTRWNIFGIHLKKVNILYIIVPAYCSMLHSFQFDRQHDNFWKEKFRLQPNPLTPPRVLDPGLQTKFPSYAFLIIYFSLCVQMLVDLIKTDCAHKFECGGLSVRVLFYFAGLVISRFCGGFELENSFAMQYFLSFIVFVLHVFLVSRDGWAALPRGVMGLSAVCDCGISWSYSLTMSQPCRCGREHWLLYFTCLIDSMWLLVLLFLPHGSVVCYEEWYCDPPKE